MNLQEPKDNIDGMTGLFNGDYGVEALRRVIDEANVLRRTNPSRVVFSEGSVGLLFVDIYKLKVPHDKYGHPPIDEVIRNVGKVIQELANETDIACRHGGDEYLLIMPGVSEGETKQRAERLRQSAMHIRVMVKGEP